MTTNFNITPFFLILLIILIASLSILKIFNPKLSFSFPKFGKVKNPPKLSQEEKTIQALKKVGAKLYGAKNNLNTISQLHKFNGLLSLHKPQDIYIQCATNNYDTPTQVCQDFFNGEKPLYPVWCINHQKIPGVQSLTTLYHLAQTHPSTGAHQAALLQAMSNNN